MSGGSKDINRGYGEAKRGLEMAKQKCKICGSRKNDIRMGICDKCAFPKKAKRKKKK